MCSNWTREDHANFTRVCNERLPAVFQASRNLQSAVGLSQGMKMIGKAPVMLWEIPEPPIQTTQEMFASLKVRMGLVNKKPADGVVSKTETTKDTSDSEMSDESEGTEELLWYPGATKGHGGQESGEVEYDGTDPREDTVSEEELDVKSGTTGYNEHSTECQIGQPRPLKRKSRNSSSSGQEYGNMSDVKKPKIVIDLTDSPDAPPAVGGSQQHAQEPLQLNSDKRSSKPNRTLRPASPPPNWVPSSRAPNKPHVPANWCHTLSKNINRWLEQSGTKSSQITLSQLELRGLPYGPRTAPVHISLYAKDYAKVKLSRLTLPPSAQQALAPLQSLDWLVVQVSLQTLRSLDNDSSWNDKDRIPLPMGAMPYWLLAFPLQAITDSKIESQRVPVSPLPPRPQNRKQGRKRSTERVLHITKLVLGKKGRVPLVHGRGIKPKFAQGFIEACAEGEGVVELRSLEAMSLMLK